MVRAMRNLLQDADRDRLAAPLEAMAAGLVLGGHPHRALPEAEGSALFPAAANADVAELLLQPGLRDRAPALPEALLDLLVALAEAPLPAGRAFAGAAELLQDDPAALLVQTPHFRFAGDLRRGVLTQQLRAPAAPTLLRHTGNLVEFRLGRRAACVDVEDSIAEAAVTREGEAVVLTHAGTIRGQAGLFAPREVEAGRLACRYEIRPGSPVLGVEMCFTAARDVADLRLSTALDGVDEDGPGGSAARLLAGGAWREAAPPAAPGAARWLRQTPLAHLALGAAGWPAGAAVAHLRPQDPARVFSATVEAKRAGAVHWLVLRHGPVTLRAGESFVVREDRLLGPGEPDAVAAAMAAGQAPWLDLDAGAPGGPALRAVATALLLDAAGAWAEPLEPARRAALAGFAVRQIAVLARRGGVSGLAQALLGADALRRAGIEADPAALPMLAASLTEALAAPAPLADRALAALALARCAAWADALPAASALCGLLDAIEPAAPGHAPALHMDGVPLDPLAEAEGIARLARAAGAAVLAAEAGAPLGEAALARARALHRIAIALLRPLVRPRAGLLSVQGPHGPVPGLQALVTLAFLAPDRLALLPARGAA